MNNYLLLKEQTQNGSRKLCNLCYYATNHFHEFSKHFVRTHENDPNFFVSCAIGACEFTTRRWNTFKVHVHRKHKLGDNPVPCAEQHEPMDVDQLNESVPFNKQDDLGYHNALYTMSLEACRNVSQTAIDHIVSSTCTLLDTQLDFVKRQLKEKLQ